jgi:hypothetical protein
MGMLQTLNQMSAANMSMQMHRTAADRQSRHNESMRSAGETRRNGGDDYTPPLDPYATKYGNQRQSKVFNASRGAIVPNDHTITGIRAWNAGSDTILYAKPTVPKNLAAQQFSAAPAPLDHNMTF